MPKFFLPKYEAEAAAAEEVYGAIRLFETGKSGWEILPDRIFRIRWSHDGKDYETEVGKPEPYEGAMTVAILRSNAYLVCTPNRGVIRGDPILVGLSEIRDVELFEDSPPTPGPRALESR